uniref:(northern house mosquito) hypothetical protein n=1 Tax=Culex pipiens TaxID=7175 RepID=A0A8D8I8P3_CULPI
MLNAVVRRRLPPDRFRLLHAARTTPGHTSLPSPTTLDPILSLLQLLIPSILLLLQPLLPLFDHLFPHLPVVLLPGRSLPAASGPLPSALRPVLLGRFQLLQPFHIPLPQLNNVLFLLGLPPTAGPTRPLSTNLPRRSHRLRNALAVGIRRPTLARVLFVAGSLRAKVLAARVHRHVTTSRTEANLLGHPRRRSLAAVAGAERFR